MKKEKGFVMALIGLIHHWWKEANDDYFE